MAYFQVETQDVSEDGKGHRTGWKTATAAKHRLVQPVADQSQRDPHQGTHSHSDHGFSHPAPPARAVILQLFFKYCPYASNRRNIRYIYVS